MDRSETLWREYAKEVIDFFMVNGRLPRMTRKERYMAAWVSSQEEAKKRGTLAQWQLELLSEIVEIANGAITESDRRKMNELAVYLTFPMNKSRGF